MKKKKLPHPLFLIVRFLENIKYYRLKMKPVTANQSNNLENPKIKKFLKEKITIEKENFLNSELKKYRKIKIITSIKANTEEIILIPHNLLNNKIN